MDFEIVVLIVIVDKEMLQLSNSSLLDIVDFFEIVDDLLLTDESTISRFYCT